MHSFLPVGTAAFLLFGVVLVLPGACHDGIVASLGLDHSGFGLLGASLSGGIGLGVLVAGPLVDRLPRRPLLLAATLIAAASLLGVGEHMSTSRAMAHIAAVGAGAGVYDTLLNAVTVQTWRERSVRPMTFLHAAVTIGAVATPALVTLAGGSMHWVWIFRMTGVAYLGVALWAFFVPLPPPRAVLVGAPHETPWSALRTPSFIALCIVAVAYVGTEAVLTLFAHPYVEAVLGLDEARGQSAITAFWAGILAGRLLLLLPRDGVGARTLAVEGIAASALVAVTIGAALSPVELWMGAIGLVLAGVFPVMISLAGRAVPEAVGTATGLVAGLGSLGGFALPWLTGTISDAFDVHLAMTSLALWCAAIGLAALVVQRATHARATLASRVHDAD